MKTFSAKEEKQKKWYIIDAADAVAGKVAVTAANILRGKNKTTFTPHIDNGDHVVIINADKVVLTGKKETGKIYTRFTGFIGNQKKETPASYRAKNRPERILELAVKGMIPKNTLGRHIFGKLRVYAGDKHEHTAQNPTPVKL